MPHNLLHTVPLSDESVNDEELLAITEEYPYYSVARFRLLSRHKISRHGNFEEEASKTVLFFSGSRWLNYQLNTYTKIVDEHNNSLPVTQLDHNKVGVITEADKERAKKTSVKGGLANQQETIAFEPLYTVDYFASQGIKIGDEAGTTDKLGTQLKSFTEWLKSMKKIHAQNLPLNDEQTDKIIQHIAETSNTNTDIVTEAMAEVLVKQEKFEQAIAMYEKLSLNYPPKSAYFAAKIQSIKPV